MLINYNRKLSLDKISVFNRSFNYGDGVFETIKVINSDIYNGEFHFNRLKKACLVLKIDFPFKDFSDFLSNSKKIINSNKLKIGGRLKIIVFREEGGFYLPNSSKSNFIIFFEKNKYNGFEFVTKNMRLCSYNVKKQITPYSFFKSPSSLYYVMASIYFKENKYDDAILLNIHNRVVETTKSNIFFVKNGYVKTPFVSEGCIDGSMRNLVMDLISSYDGYSLEESKIEYKDIGFFDEVFVTNSIQGISSVKSIDNYEYNKFNLSNDLITSIYDSI